MGAGGGHQPFAIAGETIRPGERRLVEIPVAPLYNQVMMRIRVTVLRGSRPGPCLWVSGAIHGDELCGPAIVYEATRHLDAARLAGTLLVVPAVNVFGLLQQSRYLPDRRDLNRSFPGSRRGSLAARLAHIFMKEIVDRCTHGIDLHTGAIHRTNLPQIRANLDDRETLRCARAFGAPVLVHANVRDGSLRQAATRRGVATLLYEGGEALRHDPAVVRTGSRGVLRVMAALGMIEDGPPAGPRPIVSRDTTWLRAPRSGYLILEVAPGARVRSGERVGTLHMRLEKTAHTHAYLEVRAPATGLVIGLATNPLVNVGDAILHIARPAR